MARIGAHGKAFFALQCFFSLLFFLFGNVVVSVMPKMVPAFLLFWVGLELSVWALWDLRPHRNKAAAARSKFAAVGGSRPVLVKQRPGFDWVEYFVVWSMALIGCVLGSSGMMMVAGLLFAFLITLWRLRNASIVHSSGNLQRFRSVSVRNARDTSVIDIHGDRTQVIVLTSCSLSFHNVAALVEATEQVIHAAMASSDMSLAHVIIDFSRVISISFDSCQTFHELLEMAEHHRFSLIFTGLTPHIASALLYAGVPMAFNTMQTMLAHERKCLSIGAGVKQQFACCPIDPSRSPRSSGDGIKPNGLPIGADLNTALMACEHDLLLLWRLGMDQDAPTDTSQHASQQRSLDAVRAAVPGMADQPLLPVLVDVYNWSDGYLPVGTFELSMLAVLSRYMVVEEYDDGEAVYAADFAAPRQSNGAPAAANTPPLIWVLRGTVEHRWGDGGPKRAFGSMPSRIAYNYGIAAGGIIEHGELAGKSTVGQYSIGPLATQNAFFGCMPHVGAVTAVAAGGLGVRCMCALLTRSRYDELRAEAPAVCNLLQAYCARKRFDNTTKAVGNVGNPKLVL